MSTITCSVITPQASEPNPLKFHVRIPQLREISAVKIILKLWRREIFTCKLDNTYVILPRGNQQLLECVHRDRKLFKNERLDLRSISPIPPVIENIIIECFERVKSSLSQWVMYQTEYISSVYYGNRTSVLGWFDEIIWYPDGTVDYKRTARNLLRSDKLSDAEKYVVACGFCFEDEITKMPGNESDNGWVRFSSIVNYWQHRSTGLLNEIPFEGYSCVESFMIDGVIANWPAVEYFWNRLSPDDQSRRAADIIKYRESSYIRYLLPKLNQTQLRYVLEECPLDVLVGLAQKSEYYDYALQTWHFMKDIITKETFLNILFSLLNKECEYERVADLLCELWSSSPVKFKRFVLSRDHIKEIMVVRFYRDVKYSLADLNDRCKFLILVLSETDAQIRDEFWREYWTTLIMGMHPDSIGELMYLCLRSRMEVERFKENYMSKYENIKEYCSFLITRGYIKELNIFLKFYSKPEVVANLKKNILQSTCFAGTTLFIQSSPGKPRNVRIPNMTNWRSSDNREDISSELMEHLYCLIDSGELCAVKELVDLLPICNRCLSEAKQNFAERCRQNLIAGKRCRQFAADEWDYFLKWCVGGNEKISEFKRSLPLDDIFHKLFDLCVKFCDQEITYYVRMHCNRAVTYDEGQSESKSWIVAMEHDLRRLLEPLDVFLRWYFDSEGLVREFKSVKVRGPKGEGVFETLSDIENESTYDLALKWLLERDEDRIRCFKSSQKS